MIYDFTEPSSPIGQGDIFFGVPILDLTDDELPIIDDEGNAQTLPWESFASAGKPVSAIVAVRPTIAIVGTQECDALRAPNITLFEVRPFRDVERKSKDTSKPSKWVPLITQHARINQKWFYLPADERLGFGEKMGADFLTPIRVPRLTLERLLSFRKGRLNEVAKQHFRERLAEFFRRYAYDEWYPLTREELTEYQKNHPEAEPFPWQSGEHINRHPIVQNKKGEAVEVPTSSGGKSHSGYAADLDKAIDEVTEVLARIAEAFKIWGEHLEHHIASLKRLSDEPNEIEATEVYIAIASSRDDFSERIEGILLAFEKSIEVLERSNSTYLSSLSPKSNEDIDEVSRSRNALSNTLSILKKLKVSVIRDRENALAEKGSRQNINEKTNNAINRQSKALDNLVFHIEEFESFALKMIFLINEKFGEPPLLEDKAR